MEGPQKTWQPVETEDQRDKDIKERARKMELRIKKEWDLTPKKTLEEADLTDYEDIEKLNEPAKDQAKAKSQIKLAGKKTKTSNGPGYVKTERRTERITPTLRTT